MLEFGRKATEYVGAGDVPKQRCPPRGSELRRAYAHALALLRCWSRQGMASVPFTYSQMATALSAQLGMDVNAITFFKEPLGAVWAQFYSEDPSIDAIAPQQVALLLLYALESIGTELLSDGMEVDAGANGKGAFDNLEREFVAKLKRAA